MRKGLKGKDDKDIVFLLVDDVANMRRTLRNMLKYIGYKNFIEAENGKVAMARLSVYPINFIITDLNMPLMNGIDFIKNVRNDKDYHLIPIIIISGETDKDVVAEVAELGADGYLIKPFLVNTLESKIKSVLDAVTNPERATYHFREGIIYLERKRYKEALEEFKTAIKIDPIMTKAYAGMARVFMKNNQLEKAEKVLNEALKINDKFIEGYSLLSEIYLMKNNYSEAEKYLEKAFQLSPKNIDRALDLGKISLKLNKFLDADKYFKIALKEGENKPEIKMKVAEEFLKNQMYDKAIEIYDAILLSKPNYLDAYNKLGIAYRKQKRFNEAIEAYKKAISFGGENEYVYYNIGRTYYEMGKIKEAIKFMEKSLKINEEFKEAQNALDFFKKNLKSGKN